MRLARKQNVVLALGVTQTVSWASSYYLPAVLATPMAHDLETTAPTIFAAFSFAMLIAALLGPAAGRAIDNWGGRPVLIVTNLIFAVGLIALGCVEGVVGLFIAWAVLGLGMGSGLYEAAFASLVALYGRDSRNAITGITLIAGFASTVGWPLTSFMQAHFGWREACFAWAGLHLALALPLNVLLPSSKGKAIHHAPRKDSKGTAQDATSQGGNTVWTSLVLSLVFAITWFSSAALAAHLPRLLTAAGATMGVAVAAGALMGPAQVGARILEFGLLRHLHPLVTARFATLGHPVGAILLMIFGAPLSWVFVIFHGASNGLLSIAKGTLPLVIFGPQGYGARQGVLTVPARISQALAPWLFGLCLDRWGTGALWLTSGLGIVGFVGLLALRPNAQQTDPEPATATS